VSLVVLAHHQAGGVLIEAMDDTGLDRHARQASAAVGDQRIDQRAGGVAGGRVDDQASAVNDTTASSRRRC
jgi:hypothetical protein